MGNEKVRLRRYKDDLYVSGTGAVIMGAWSVIKIIMDLFLGSEEFIDLKGEDPAEQAAGIITALVVIIVLSLIVLRIHLYIGLNAMRAAREKEHKKGYRVAAIIMLVLSVAGMALYKNMFNDPENLDTTLASIFVDLTTIYVFVIVLRSAHMIDKIKENTQE